MDYRLLGPFELLSLNKAELRSYRATLAHYRALELPWCGRVAREEFLEACDDLENELERRGIQLGLFDLDV